jgi:hypothetical protein
MVIGTEEQAIPASAMVLTMPELMDDGADMSIAGEECFSKWRSQTVGESLKLREESFLKQIQCE